MTEEDIFADALGVAPEDRKQFLSEACRGDERVRKRVAELLELHDRPDEFLDASPDPAMSSIARETAGVSPDTSSLGSTEAGHDIGPFGGHELLDEIARGAMGVVYRARQKKLNRIVALKVIRPHLIKSAKDAQRFLVEARILAKLNHPNIMPIFDAGEDEGRHYFSMPLIEEGSLYDQMPAYVGHPIAGVEVIVRIARAVGAAHRTGILHRDIKPGNILVGCDGVPYITDFGLAKDTHTDQQLTAVGEVLGTPSYMAPEQASQGTKTVTAAADIYALGAVLYELLTGQPPHKADTILDTLRLVESTDPAPLRSLDPSIDPDLEAIVLKCLARNPRRRYATAEDLADALGRWLDADRTLLQEFFFAFRDRRVAASLVGAGVLAVTVLGLLVFAILALVLVSRLPGLLR